MSMVFTFVTNKRTEIYILLIVIFLRELFPTIDSKDYILASLVFPAFMSEFVGFFCIIHLS